MSNERLITNVMSFKLKDLARLVLLTPFMRNLSWRPTNDNDEK